MEQQVQLAILFAGGFLVSRLMVKAGLPERLVAAILAHDASHARVVLCLTAGTAVLSLLIPNAVTVITVLPVLALVRERLVGAHPDARARITTLLGLSVIYGANVGGMGSITGTPANGVLAVYAALQGVDDHGLLRFDSWLVWGVPLVGVMVVASFLVICASAGPQIALTRLGTCVRRPAPAPLEPTAWWVAGGFVVVAFVLSAAMGAPGHERAVLAATALAGAGLGAALFAGRHRGERILELRDCYHDLPLRGLAFVAAFVLVAVAAAALGLVEVVASWAGALVPADLGSASAYVVLAAFTSFATELFSNTVVQLALFEALSELPQAGPVQIELMLVVTLSCTCAFMSPLATGVNGLVFGELRGLSLPRMLATGVAMNAAGAVIVGLWIHAFVG